MAKPSRCPRNSVGLTAVEAATNNVAERAIRGMVIARKVWGGSRTPNNRSIYLRQSS